MALYETLALYKSARLVLPLILFGAKLLTKMGKGNDLSPAKGDVPDAVLELFHALSGRLLDDKIDGHFDRLPPVELDRANHHLTRFTGLVVQTVTESALTHDELALQSETLRTGLEQIPEAWVSFVEAGHPDVRPLAHQDFVQQLTAVLQGHGNVEVISEPVLTAFFALWLNEHVGKALTKQGYHITLTRVVGPLIGDNLAAALPTDHPAAVQAFRKTLLRYHAEAQEYLEEIKAGQEMDRQRDIAYQQRTGAQIDLLATDVMAIRKALDCFQQNSGTGTDPIPGWSNARLAGQLDAIEKALGGLQKASDPQDGPVTAWSRDHIEREVAIQTHMDVEDLRAIFNECLTTLVPRFLGPEWQSYATELSASITTLEQEQALTKQEVKASRRWGLWAAAAILLILGGIGWGLRHLTTQSETVSGTVKQVQEDVKEVKEVFAKERKFMALILARANDRIKDWENMTPAERFDLALDQIAAEEKIPAKELRDLLDLYVQRVEIDPDAEAEDKYYVLMRRQSFGEAAKLAGTEAESSEARMKQQATRRAAAEVIAEKAAEQEKAERQRAIDFYQKEGDAHLSAFKYEDAITAFRNAAEIVDKKTDPLGWCLIQKMLTFGLLNLAKYKEAEPLIREILRLQELHSKADQSELAITIGNLGSILQLTNRQEEAEPLIRRALEIVVAIHGPDHPLVATSLNNLAQVLQARNQMDEAELIFRRVLVILAKAYGNQHYSFGTAVNNLAWLLQTTKRYSEAEQWYRQLLKSYRPNTGLMPPYLTTTLNNLTQLLFDTNRQEEAEPIMRRALEIDEARYGPDHPNVAIRLNKLAQLLQATNRLGEAESLMRRALEINEASYGPNHPNVAIDLHNLGQLLRATNRLGEAESLMRRALEINEVSYGPNHPNVALDLHNLAQLFQATNRLGEAESLMRRALEIDEASYAPGHPSVARGLNNLAQLLRVSNRLEEAEPLMRRALEALVGFWQKARQEHPQFRLAAGNYRSLLADMGLGEAEIEDRIGRLKRGEAVGDLDLQKGE